MPGARQIVDPPVFTVTPYGLLTVCQFPSPGDEHWQNGITYLPTCVTAPSSTYDECIAVSGSAVQPGPPPAFTSTVSKVQRGATSFSVFVEFDCSAVGNEEARQTAMSAMASVESWQVERSFWTGIAGGQPVVYPHLAANAQILDGFSQTSIVLQSAAVVVSGAGFDTNTDMAQSLGLLEGVLADCYNGVGIIHVPEHAIPALDAWGLIRTQGPQMKTINGNLVAVGAGYPGTSPAGAARTADKTWLYATGAVMCYRSDLTIRPTGLSQAFDRSKNTIKMIAERRYVLGWDCCHFAVNASLGVPKGT